MASWDGFRSVHTLARRLFSLACVGLAALVGVLIVVAVIDWSGV